ncbi:MAG TPA: LCP family protein [Candidatus Eubacterium faecavium]|nr:LCP family protein [Candidatus Eubacterium faecavium]
MRLFKNRGDIYIPSTREKADIEQKVLLIVLIFVVIFTAVFLLIFGIKYDFSVKNFFTPDDLQQQEEEVVQQLPEVQGKTNYLLILSNKNTQEMYFCSLFQADMDTVSYKSCTFSPQTVADENSVSQIYKNSGAAGVANSLSRLFGIEIDFYIDMDYSDYATMFDYLGSVNYTVLNNVRYKDTSRYGYNIRISAGNQKLDGDNAVKLMRYYVSQENNYTAVNDILLSAASQHMNEENYANRESVFSRFIEYSQTDFTVRDFTQKQNDLLVLSSSTTGVNIYSVPVIYEGKNLTSDSVSDILGYFSK